MKLRVLATAFLVVLLSLGAMLLLSSQKIEEQKIFPKRNFSVAFLPLEYGIADSEREEVGFLIVDANISGAEGNLTLLLLPEKPPTSIYFLEHPYAEASSYDEFKLSLLAQLREYGVKPENIEVNNALKLKNSLLIIPTGLLPKRINENIFEILENGNVLIYLGKEQDYLIDADGSIVKNERKVIDYSGAKGGANYSVLQRGDSKCVSSGPGHFFIIPKTINDFKNGRDAARAVSEAILFSRWQKPIAQNSLGINYSYEGRLTLLTGKGKRSSGILRFLYSFSGENESASGLLDFPVQKLKGRLLHKSSAFPGEELSAQLNLNESYEQPVFLVLRVEAWKEGEKILQKKVGEANVRNVWFSSFIFSENLTPGDYILVVKDQFNREHAKSHLHIKNLSLTLSEIHDTEYIFSVLLDSVPVSNERAEVSLDSSNKSEVFPVSEGKLRILAKVPKGEHVFRVSLLGQKRELPFTNISSSPFDIYITYGIPGLALVILTYFVFRKGKSRKYVLQVPDLGEEKIRVVEMRVEDLLKIFSNVNKEFGWKMTPLTVGELRYGLKKYALKEGREIVVTEANLAEVLENLVRKGILSNWKEYYAPREWLKKTSIEREAMRRMVRDSLIEKGMAFKEGKFIRSRSGNEEVQIYIYEKDSEILGMSEKARRIVVFPDAESLSEFKSSLISDEEKKIKLSIALQNNSLLLSTVDNLRGVL